MTKPERLFSPARVGFGTLALTAMATLSACTRAPEPLPPLTVAQMQSCAALYDVLLADANLSPGDAPPIEKLSYDWGQAAYFTGLERQMSGDEIEQGIRAEFDRLESLARNDRRSLESVQKTCKSYEEAPSKTETKPAS
jgi:hypothetical protein